MKYEIVPNILEDDDTINIRIPLDSENASRRDVQFLCTKYKNTYSIYGVSIESVGSGFSAFWNWNLRQDELRFCMPKGKEPLIYSIADTLRLACNSTSDHDVYIKVFSKVSRLFSNGSERPTVNEFSNLLLLYPTEPQVTDLYIYERLQYINTLLGIKQSTTNQTKLKFISRMANNGFSIDCIKKIFPELVQEYSYRILPFDYSPSLNTTRTYNKELYQLAYTASVKITRNIYPHTNLPIFKKCTLAASKLANGKVKVRCLFLFQKSILMQFINTTVIGWLVSH